MEAGGSSSEHHYPRLQPSLEITNSLYFPQSASSLNRSLEFFIKKLSAAEREMHREWTVRSDATPGCCCKPAKRFKASPARPAAIASESRCRGRRQRESAVKANKAGRSAFHLNAGVALLSVSGVDVYAAVHRWRPWEDEASSLPTGHQTSPFQLFKADVAVPPPPDCALTFNIIFFHRGRKKRSPAHKQRKTSSKKPVNLVYNLTIEKAAQFWGLKAVSMPVNFWLEQAAWRPSGRPRRG